MNKKILRSMVTIQRELVYNIDWLDIEHQIYNEDRTTTHIVKVFGIRVWNFKRTLITKHTIKKNDKKIGFGSDEGRK